MFSRSPCMNNENERKCNEMKVLSVYKGILRATSGVPAFGGGGGGGRGGGDNDGDDSEDDVPVIPDLEETCS